VTTHCHVGRCPLEELLTEFQLLYPTPCTGNDKYKKNSGFIFYIPAFAMPAYAVVSCRLYNVGKPAIIVACCME